MPPLRVVVAGGGIAGNVFARLLKRRAQHAALQKAKPSKNPLAPGLSLTAYERRRKRDASPPGLNVLMNHNGMETLEEVDPDLYRRIIAGDGSGSDRYGSRRFRNWSARTVSGKILYDVPDAVSEGLAGTPGVVARWDLVHAATRVDANTEFGAEVVRVEEDPCEPEGSGGDDDDKEKLLRVLVRRYDDPDDPDAVTGEEWIGRIDYVVACGGRYCSLRHQLSPPAEFYGPPHVTDFRIVTSGTPEESLDGLFPPDRPIWRIHNAPSLPDELFEGDSKPSLRAAASGVVRVGIMRLGPTSVGVFGNLPMKGEERDETLRNPEDLERLFTPSVEGGDDPPDAMGRLLLDVLRESGGDAHWTRKQETDTRYEAMGGRVLFVGDSAGAIYPSLGQGANLSLEDAAVAAALFPDVAKISSIRTPRREFIKAMSRRHAEHVTDPKAFARECAEWSDPASRWRSDLLPRLWCGRQNGIRAVTATRESILPYGQLIAESEDGAEYSEIADAVLDLSGGTPRFYMMKLEGDRPLVVGQITRHKNVTQCLGCLGADEDFYLVLHEPADEPTIRGLRAFRIPPRHFVKLEKGAWHVGPLWDDGSTTRTFYNLELADTNIVDHHCIPIKDLIVPPRKSEGGAADEIEAADPEIRRLLAEESEREVLLPIFPAMDEAG